MAPAAAGKRANPAQAIGHGAHAHDHHRPSAGLGDAADPDTWNIAEILRYPRRYPDLATSAVRPGEIGRIRQLPVELQRLAVHQAVAPRIDGRNPLRLGLDDRRNEFAWHLQDRRIVIAAGFKRLIPYPRAQLCLDRRRDGRGAPTITGEGEQAALIARKDRDQQTSEQKQEQHRILLAALRAHPIGRPTGRNHLSPTPHPTNPSHHRVGSS